MSTQSSKNEGYGADGSSNNNEPQNFRLLSDIYNEMEKIGAVDELLLLEIDEPATYEQAAKKRAWKVAIQNEIDAIERYETWELTELQPVHKAINLKLVFKLTKDTAGKIVKHEARLVANGYVQKYGVDYKEVFSPVTRMETVRLLLALDAKNEWEVHHLDVKFEVLNGELQEVHHLGFK